MENKTLITKAFPEDVEKRVQQVITTATDIARQKGFGQNEGKLKRMLMLTLGELSEGLEAIRKSEPHRANLNEFELALDDEPFVTAFEKHVKDTFEDEVADTIIRLAHILGSENIEPLVGAGFASPEVKAEDGFADNAFDIGAMIYTLFFYLKHKQDRKNMIVAASVLMNTLIMLGDLYDFDIWRHIQLKMTYNETRDKLHGKQF